MTHEGREANILKHFTAGTLEELEDGAALLAWADNPSEQLLDAAEIACKGLWRLGNERAAEGVRAWFRVMADCGNVLAMDHYGWMFDDPKAEERVYWFRKAAELGGAHAQNSLGYCLHEGLGVERNRNEALRLFRASAAQGNRFGQESLARAYYEPDFAGLPQNLPEAFRLWKLSAEQGWHWSQFHLGECYENGFGTNSDLAEARRWYTKAAKAGNGLAKSALTRLNDALSAEHVLQCAIEGEVPLIFLIDGHNAIYALQSRYSRPQDHRGPPSEARDRLVDDIVQIFSNAHNCRVIIVFDGPERTESNPANNVKVIYSGGSSAVEHRTDDVLVDEARFLREADKDVCMLLATNDNGLASRAGAFNVRTIPPTALLPYLR